MPIFLGSAKFAPPFHPSLYLKGIEKSGARPACSIFCCGPPISPVICGRAHDLLLPSQCRLRWEKPGCAWEEQTRTKQLSPCGALLECHHSFRPGEILLIVRTDTDSEFVWHLPASNMAMPCRKLVRGDEP